MGKYNRTIKGQIHYLYNSQKGSSRKRNMVMPSYSKQEFTLWLYSQPLYFELFDKWRLSDYNRMEAPSVDRLDDSKPYTFSNIQLMSFRENNSKSHKDRKSGKLLTSQNRAVSQFTKDFIYIRDFSSIAIAGREVGSSSHGKITDVCKKKRKTAYGFYWEYSGGVPSE